MKLYIKNIAKIKEAEIAVDGITVIAGVNNTGKSTIGKVLFGIFQSLQNKDERILESKENYVSACMSPLFDPLRVDGGSSSSADFDYVEEWLIQVKSDLAKILVKKYRDSGDKIKLQEVRDCVRDFLNKNQRVRDYANEIESENEITYSRILKYINLPSENILAELIQSYFNDIFNEQVNSLDAIEEDAIANLFIKDIQTKFVFSNNTCTKAISPIELENKVIYIDNPSLISKLSPLNPKYHLPRIMRTQIGVSPMEVQVSRMLVSNRKNDSVKKAIGNLIHKERLSEISHLINSAIDATVLPSDEGYQLREKGVKYGVDFANLSFGLRAFVILKMLLEKDLIQDKDVIVLDEPEIHLHPQWQVLFAHLIVLIQKEFNLSVVITTHSHFFVDAINLYTRKYKTDSTTHYYLASLEGRRAIITDTTDNLNVIYDAMAVAVDELEDLRHELEEME